MIQSAEVSSHTNFTVVHCKFHSICKTFSISIYVGNKFLLKKRLRESILSVPGPDQRSLSKWTCIGLDIGEISTNQTIYIEV